MTAALISLAVAVVLFVLLPWLSAVDDRRREDEQ